MAFRTEAKTCARVIVMLGLGCAGLVQSLEAQTKTYAARHRHLHNGAAGILRIDGNLISFEEPGKHARDSRQWKYEDIQQIVLGPDSLRIVTYEDQRWEFGRDREYLFDHLPATLAHDWYPIFSKTLDGRFVAALADTDVKPAWQVPVKLAHGNRGSQGDLLVAADHIVYRSAQAGESRTWRIADIQNVSSSGPFDLTLVTQERDFRFQLRRMLPEGRLDELWRKVNFVHGLQILSSTQNASKGQTGDKQ